MLLKLILITVVLMALAFAFIGIKMFIKRGGEFKKQCSTIDPETGDRFGCTCGNQSTTCENN
ncbi:MAG: membrane or secreted protein [Bacteroidetes bacterium]|nr:membrane or secreted protein [Bacteroidota bacterium]